MVKNILLELKKYNLLGRSGSGFPTALKWQLVKKAKADKKYIICNCSEGEPKNFKDKFILENYPEVVIEGIKTALEFIDNSSAFIYLKKEYYDLFIDKLNKLTKGLPIEIVKKKGGYLGGEETVICQALEGKRLEPRVKPPFPVESGLNGCPTLINNAETFYCVGRISKGEYKKTRFYTIAGDVNNKGVFELPEKYTIKEILEETGNYPSFDFFVQSGGGAMGEILLSKELDKQVQGIGCIVIFNSKTDPYALMKEWAQFFLAENCDRCTPCREGIYRINEMLNNKNLDKQALNDIFLVLKETSLCPLGANAYKPFETLIKKIIK
jgi:NADH:ubiquinone oxidoreductase subunit F (NADH-binding)